MMYKIIILTVFVILSEVVEGKTDCEEHRERESKSTAPLPMRLIPECDSKGDYKSLQCFKDSQFCACWNKTGHPVSQPSKKIKKCECMVKKHEVNSKRLVGAFLPDCEEDGSFKKVQCHGSTGQCWCTHPETGEKTSEPATGKPTCP